ncbi:MAG: tRNA 2-thiouridine(34) synthase MnmA [Deltaproteobacteria bacterium]|nr:tRNA 2-thiouridine(34) synthase MnmA [Deltaproteobacteria bacterium]
MRIVVAMSGGVDSSTAAALLKEQGHDVIGVTLKTHTAAHHQARVCCTTDVLNDALRVALHLQIPFEVQNCQEAFGREVILPFVAAYQDGRTPNPCIACNERIKFGLLWERARALGATRIATGHYARLETDSHGRTALRRGRDAAKDQSYFLYRQVAVLDRALFPVGGYTKVEVRALAARFGLPVAEKIESQEICFVGADGYAATVERLAGGGRPGPILDPAGKVLGRHDGVHHFTLGQRHGLGVSAPTPLYVTAIDAMSGEVRVGRQEDLLVRVVELADVVWGERAIGPDQVVGVQQRYRDRARPARVRLGEKGRAIVTFVEPTPRAAPGQAAVVYDGDEVLGGGVVVRSHVEVTPAVHA